MIDEAAEVRKLLLGLEMELMNPAVRRDRGRVMELLADDFAEFGASGRAWTREEILNLLATEAFEPPQIEDFHCRIIGPGVTLATYRTIRTDTRTGARTNVNRSSIWTFQDGCWRMRLHQGTPAAEPQRRDP